MRGRVARLARAENLARRRAGADPGDHSGRVFRGRLALVEGFLADLPDDPVADRAVAALDLDRVCGWLYHPGWCTPLPPAPAVETLAWMRACWDLPGRPHPDLDGTRGRLTPAYLQHLLAAPAGAALSPWPCRCRVLLPEVTTPGGGGRPRPLADRCPACGADLPGPRRC